MLYFDYSIDNPRETMMGADLLKLPNAIEGETGRGDGLER